MAVILLFASGLCYLTALLPLPSPPAPPLTGHGGARGTYSGWYGCQSWVGEGYREVCSRTTAGYFFQGIRGVV